jgi:branched-chain amino acid transport system ATP-binding protein
MGEEVFIQIIRVTKSFGGITAIREISFDLRRGEILGLIGPNGSGKTTLVNLITGFVKPDSGEVFFRERKITGLQPHKIADLGVTGPSRMRPYHSLPAYRI